MSRPSVAVNLSWCIPGGVGGSEEYLCRQLIGLPEGAFDLEIFAPRGFRQAHPELSERYPIVEMPHDAHRRGRRIWSESTWLYRRTRRSQVVHHGGGTVPGRHTRPLVLTIHDLQYLTYPQYFHPVRRAYLRRVMPRSVRRSDVITVPSEFVKGSVVDAFGVDPERVLVVPHGVESTIGRSATDAETLRRRYRLGAKPIVVLPAVTHPHKGHLFALDVMTRVDDDLTLVMIGGTGSAEGAVLRRLEDESLRTRVAKLGRVPADDRDGLVAMARAVVFPSEYEGFGAPVIEAMALGTPVIASDRTCLPEVVGEAGLIVPLEVQAWVDALRTVESHHRNLVDLGRRRVEQFSADRSGAALAAAYRQAIA